MLLVLAILTLAFFIYILRHGVSKLHEQVQQLCQINSGLTAERATSTSTSIETACSTVHTFKISLDFEHQPPQVVIEFPHESWASAFQLRLQRHFTDPMLSELGVPHASTWESEHYNRHFVSVPIPRDVTGIQFKRAEDGIIFVCPERPRLDWHHWSRALFMWKPVPSRAETKMQLRQVWSHQDFDHWFGPGTNNRRRAAGERGRAYNEPRARDDGGLPAGTARGPAWAAWHGVPRPSPRPIDSLVRREHAVAWRGLFPRHREEAAAAANQEADGEGQDSDSYFSESSTSSTSSAPSASSTSTRPRPRPAWLERLHRRRRTLAAQPRGLRAGRTAHARASSTHRL